MNISDKVIGRLSLYRRLLHLLSDNGYEYVYSHDLASYAKVSSAQIRRDIMNIGYFGNPNKGYNVKELITSIGKFLDGPSHQYAALVGVGNLGKAILDYFSGRRPKLSIAASFDSDSQKQNRVIHGCRCYSITELNEIISKNNISIGIIAVPTSAAQQSADMLINAGVKGLLNFVPVPLKVPSNIYIEDIDMTMSLEKVAYFARQNNVKG
ncbi:redox-sensing transcriptional repressor Rex [Candidatus Latescibacterota bacterium]